MKISLWVLFFMVSLTGSIRARLGETEDQLTARYGQELLKTKVKVPKSQLALDGIQFVKSGFGIHVTIFNGFSAEEEIHKAHNEPITDDDAKTLLDVNSQGHVWTEETTKTDMPRKWHRDDGARAELYLESFDVKTKDLIDAKTAAQQTFHENTLEGF